MWDNFVAFWERPYKGAAEMSVVDWFLITGMFLTVLVVWNLIFRHVIEGITQ